MMDQQKMKTKLKKRRNGLLRCEMILMLAIIIGLSYMIVYNGMVNRYTAMSVTPNGNLAVLHNQSDMELFQSYGWPVIKFHHDSTQFITLYDEEGNEVYQLICGDVISLKDKIDNRYNWWNLFKDDGDDKGTIPFQNDELNMIINYKWVSFEDGPRYLIVYNTHVTIDKMLTTYNTISYITITLCFVMLVYIIYIRYYELANKYKIINAQVQEIIKK